MPLSGVSVTQHYPSETLLESFPSHCFLLSWPGQGGEGKLLKHLQTARDVVVSSDTCSLPSHAIVHPQTLTVWLEKHDLPYSSSNPEEGTVSPAKEEI